MAGATMSEREEQRLFFVNSADIDPVAQKAYDYYSYGTYGGITYGKTASVLLTLESIVGEDTMAKAMHTYFMKYRFTHPTKEDFLKTIEEVSGKDLRWYFNQAVYGTQVMDYKVLNIESYPVNWYDEATKGPGMKSSGQKADKDTVYRSSVWLQRKGEFVMPVEVEIVFQDGDDHLEKVREHWDGASRWTKFSYEKKAKIVSAEIDPDHEVQIDGNDFNNSKTVEPNGKPARKLTNYWVFVTQWIGQALAWWAV
jgi:aminopeptidase N